MIKDLIKKHIPSKYHFLLVNLKNNLWGFRKSYYSQFGEDVVLNTLFKDKINGFYVDVGAHHPKRYSNTYLLYKKGWKGINIDPNPYTIKLFNRQRKGDINLNMGVSSNSEELIYYYFSDPALNTFSEEESKKWLDKDWVELLGKEKVKCSRLGDILNEHLPKDTKIDLLTVDAEGMDLDVLKSNDWSRFKPQVVVVESEGFDIENPDENQIFSFLKERNYGLHAVMGRSLIFISKNPE